METPSLQPPKHVRIKKVLQSYQLNHGRNNNTDGRNPANQLIGSLSHLQGFIHPKWCRISSINSITWRFTPKNKSWGSRRAVCPAFKLCRKNLGDRVFSKIETLELLSRSQGLTCMKIHMYYIHNSNTTQTIPWNWDTRLLDEFVGTLILEVDFTKCPKPTFDSENLDAQNFSMSLFHQPQPGGATPKNLPAGTSTSPILKRRIFWNKPLSMNLEFKKCEFFFDLFLVKSSTSTGSANLAG